MVRLKNSITFSRIVCKISVSNCKVNNINLCWKLRYLYDEIKRKLIRSQIEIKWLKQENKELKERLECQK